MHISNGNRRFKQVTFNRAISYVKLYKIVYNHDISCKENAENTEKLKKSRRYNAPKQNEQ